MYVNTNRYTQLFKQVNLWRYYYTFIFRFSFKLSPKTSKQIWLDYSLLQEVHHVRRVEEIEKIEAEMTRIPKNKVTSVHLDTLKAKMRREVIKSKSQGGARP